MSVGVVGQQLPVGAVSPSAHVSVSVISIVTRFTSVAITAKTSISAYGGIPVVTPISPILATPAVVVSHAYISASQVIKVQFATTQSPPAEIVFFDTFQNGRYLPPPAGSYAWNDQEDWNTVGMGDVQVSFNAQTLTPTIVRGASLVSPSGHNNGIVSAPFQTSPKGYVTFAVRLNIVSVPATNPNFFTEYPIYLQLCLWNGSGNAPTVLQQWALSANTVGQTIEQYFSYLVGSATGGSTSEFLCLAVAQHSGAACPAGQTASWTIQAASAFDPSIVWSFSSDSSTWVDAVSVNPVRNNRNGITSLASPSTSLYWKCTIYRPDMYVTSLKLRPWYLGSDLPRLAPVAEGPNLTFSDPDQTIWTDPEFNPWALPVPIWWFARYAQLNFFPDGVPTVLPTSNHYVLTADESIGLVSDTAAITSYVPAYQAAGGLYGTFTGSDVPQTIVPASAGTLAATFTATSSATIIPEVAGGSGGLVASFTGSDTGTMQVTHFVTLNYLGTTGSGTVQDWMVPLNLIGTTVQVVVTGGGCGTTAPSYGGQVTATVPATSGETFQVYVGESSFPGSYTDVFVLSGSVAKTLTQVGIVESTIVVTDATGVIQASDEYTIVQTGTGINLVTTIELATGTTMTTTKVYYITYVFITDTGGWGYHTGGGHTAFGGNPGYGGAGSSALLTSLGALLVEAGGAGGMGGAFTGYTIGQSPYQNFAAGGNGGGAATSAGTAGTFSEFYMELGSTVYWGIADGGYGATQSVAGVGGYINAGSSPAFSDVQQNGNPGTVGGAPTTANGGLGVQSQYCNSGGGGGGYAGGGSGAAVGDNNYSVGAGAAGGGGSSWAGGGVSGVTYAVPASTAGSVTIIWTASS